MSLALYGPARCDGGRLGSYKTGARTKAAKIQYVKAAEPTTTFARVFCLPNTPGMEHAAAMALSFLIVHSAERDELSSLTE